MHVHTRRKMSVLVLRKLLNLSFSSFQENILCKDKITYLKKKCKLNNRFFKQ